MALNRREIDNLVNKINKRVETLATRLGRDTEEYQAMSRKIVTGLAPIDTITPTSIQRDYVYKFKADNRTINLSRSMVLWRKFADKYGEKAVMDFLHSLEDMPTYVEHATKMQKKYEATFGEGSGKGKSIREMSIELYDNTNNIGKAFELIYELQLGDNGYSSDIMHKAQEIIDESRQQGEMDQQQRDDFLKGVSDFAKTLDFSSNQEQHEYNKNVVEKFTRRKHSALTVLRRKQYKYEQEWLEEQHGGKKVEFPIDREALQADIERIENALTINDLSNAEMDEIMRRW